MKKTDLFNDLVLNDDVTWDSSEGRSLFFEIITLLDKAEPRKVKVDDRGWCICPVCGKFVTTLYYCGFCGQKVERP